VTSTTIPGLIDTEVLIACALGLAPALRFFLSQNQIGGIQFSRLSALELLSKCQSDADRARAVPFITNSVVHEITNAISRRAFDLLTTIPLPTTLTADDAIIAATAIEHSLPLYTLSPARFANLSGVAAIQPY
jgi:predicted nucleic acid-binding protein